MTDKKTLTMSSAPFLRSKDSIEKVMYTVAIALLPSVLASVYFFGIRALLVTLCSVASCIFFAWIVDILRKRPRTYLDGSAIVTGILIALNVPAGLPYWMLIIGGFVAIILSKELYGGLGHNPFNPALVARVFLLISFPVAMTAWPSPHTVDIATGATPLGILKTDGVSALSNINLWNSFIGNVPGSLGETSAIAILLGAALLYFKGYINLKIPLSFIGSLFAFTGIFYLIDPSHYASPVFHLLSGGLMLGAFFMATDMVTSPISWRGQLIFGTGCGLLTGIIRLFGGYPEGVSFAILIMNSIVPLLDKFDEYILSLNKIGANK